MRKLFHSRLFFIAIATLLIGLAVFFLFRTLGTSIPADIEIQPVSRGDVIEIISETGFVQPSREVDLAFERGGRIVSTPVHEGDHVEEGSVLIALDTSEIEAELNAAYARLRAEEVRLDELIRGADELSLGVTQSGVTSAQVTLENAQANLELITAQHDQLVENTQKTLLSSDLEAHFIGDESSNSSYSYTPPTISGTYESDVEGTYIVDLYHSGAPSGASFQYSGLETGTESVSTDNPQPLGRQGLYIQFPNNFAKNTGVLWEVAIPNTRASGYLTNLNAYNAALEAREVAIESASNAIRSAEAAFNESELQLTQVSSSARDERIEAQRALVRQMQAGAEAIEIAKDNMTLIAPFSGIVTSMDNEEGEIVSAGASALSLISDDNFELVVNISESDIQEIGVGDSAAVRFDAYDDAVFAANIIRIAPNAKIVDGVRIFEVTLEFSEKDERIRSGLSADIDILAAERVDVLAVPSRAVVEREDGKFVRVLLGSAIEYLPVTTGLRGSDGKTEIVNGLASGQEIITFASEEAIEELE